jgi:hypothetical protein
VSPASTASLKVARRFRSVGESGSGACSRSKVYVSSVARARWSAALTDCGVVSRRGGFVGVEAEHVAQHERGALLRRQLLQRDDERELDRFALLVAGFRSRSGIRKRAVRVRLEPAGLDGAAGSRQSHGVLRGWAVPAVANRVETPVGRDPVEPGAQRRPLLETVESTPGGKQRFLDEILGVLHGAEQPVAMQLELAPERLDQRRERTLVTCLGPLEIDGHRVNDTRSFGNGPAVRFAASRCL